MLLYMLLGIFQFGLFNLSKVHYPINLTGNKNLEMFLIIVYRLPNYGRMV